MMTKSSPFDSLQCVTSGSGITHFFSDMSPMARLVARFPATLATPPTLRTSPPAASIRARSDGDDGLCSADSGSVAPIRTMMALESPALAQNRSVPLIKTLQAVVPSSQPSARAADKKAASVCVKTECSREPPVSPVSAALSSPRCSSASESRSAIVALQYSDARWPAWPSKTP